MDKPIEMPFGVYTSPRGPGNVLDGVHIDATCRIRLNDSCASAMRSYVKLLWPFVCCFLQTISIWLYLSGTGLPRLSWKRGR